MRYSNIHEVSIVKRENRFIATVIYNGDTIPVHVKNTGRLPELIYEGAKGYITLSDNPMRSTFADLVASERYLSGRNRVINIDSNAPNDMVREWLPDSGLFSPQALIKREVTYGDSRFDIYVEDGERRAFIEVKGVTLIREGIAVFPDAPTDRGRKHIHGLIDAVKSGYEGYIIFVIQTDGVDALIPNRETDPAFADSLAQAFQSGVKVLAYDSYVTPISAEIKNPVRVILTEEKCTSTK